MVGCCHLEQEVHMRSLLFLTNVACSLVQLLVRSSASLKQSNIGSFITDN